MSTKCEYSTLDIPNDHRYGNVAGKYVVEIASMIGFEVQDLHAIELGVIQVVTAVIDYSFEPGEKETIKISCERIPEGLKVSIRDKGLPYDDTIISAENRTEKQSSLGLQIFRLKEYLDEVVFHNLGLEGKEIVLIKHLKSKGINDYYAACELEPYEKKVPEGGLGTGPLKCRIRWMKESEAAEVSKSVYKTYGYSYGHDYVYYPEKIIALNQSGKIHSAVALIGESEIAGHCALQYWEENFQIAEMVQGVVKPEFRSQGCFTKLTEFLIEQAKSEGLMGIFGQPVTNHIYSQRTAHRFGLRDCALMLAHVPMTSTFKDIAETLPQRVGLLLHFKYLNRPTGLTIQPPSQHLEMISKIYENLGVLPTIQTSAEDLADILDQTSAFSVKVFGPLNLARITIKRYGRNVINEIKIRLKELCLKKIEVVNLYLDLSNASTSRFTAQFEEMGFFFAGLLPGGLPGGDALILQYLNNVPINYEEIHVDSDMAKELVSYIRKSDPNLL